MRIKQRRMMKTAMDSLEERQHTNIPNKSISVAKASTV